MRSKNENWLSGKVREVKAPYREMSERTKRNPFIIVLRKVIMNFRITEQIQQLWLLRSEEDPTLLGRFFTEHQNNRSSLNQDMGAS